MIVHILLSNITNKTEFMRNGNLTASKSRFILMLTKTNNAKYTMNSSTYLVVGYLSTAHCLQIMSKKTKSTERDVEDKEKLIFTHDTKEISFRCQVDYTHEKFLPRRSGPKRTIFTWLILSVKH